ncbi:MAG: motility associated factor glycosyltransferase family protein [Lachnospiraceae bacterium]|nr:motility associated factor glycosyltransferase family protein [Lachnospiraceae bacterium]
MIYENNLKALCDVRPDLYEAVIKEKEYDDGLVVMEEAKNGEKIVKYCKGDTVVYLNSTYNPAREAEKYMSDVVGMPDESVLTIIGLANGAFLKEFVKKRIKNVHCVVYEPSIAVFMEVVKSVDITDILADKNVFLVVEGIDDSHFGLIMSDYIQIYNRNTNVHMILPKYKELFPESCRKIEHILNEQYDRVRAEEVTVTEYGVRCCKNGLYNTKRLVGCRSGRDYVGIFPENMPVIIVSAGPSLTKNVELLKEAKGKALILVVDTAIPKVISRDIIPDMIISVDYHKSKKHFNVGDLSDIPFLADMDTNAKVLAHVKPKNLIFNSSDSLLWARLFEEAGSEICTIESGGSVSTAAIGHMISWGFRKIILVGQDLALTGNMVHADEEEAKVEDLDMGLAYVKDLEGNDILTRKDYRNYIRWIEEIGYQFRDIEIIDATEGGAYKEHTTIMTLRQAIDTYCQEIYDINTLLNKPPVRFVGENYHIVTEGFNQLKNNMRNLRKLFLNAAADARMGALMLERGDFNVKELKRINANMANVESKLLASEERIYITKYVADADIEMADDMYMEDEDDIKESIRLYKKSEKYYQRISDAIPEIIKEIDYCIETMPDNPL